MSHVQMLARANKERLAVLLDEVKDRSGNSQERYAAALRYGVGGCDGASFMIMIT